MSTIHIIGAGLSGLSSAITAARSDANVKIYEATGSAGGRARSFFDSSLDCHIDNGNHLLLGANTETLKYLDRIGARNTIAEMVPASFPFVRTETTEQWEIKPRGLFFPFWILSQNRRIPGTTTKDYIQHICRLSRANSNDTVGNLFPSDTVLFEALWDPLCRAILNTPPKDASAQLLWTVFKKTFMRGETACRPWFFKDGIGAALIKPATKFLSAHNTEIQFKNRLRRIHCDDNSVKRLMFSTGTVEIGQEDSIILALPPDACNLVFAAANAPTIATTIINAHFRLNRTILLPGNKPFLGIIGGNTQWLFVRKNILSLTISADNKLVDEPNWKLAKILWDEARLIVGNSNQRLPAWRIIKERRATFAQTPKQVKNRPGTKTELKNLFLAGDWTDTGLPATIEGSIKSGFRAAKIALRDSKIDAYK